MTTILSKSSPPEGASVASVRRVEITAAVHAAVLVIFASWCFGGNIGWGQTGLTIGGAPGLIIAWSEFRRRQVNGKSLRPFLWLWPLAGFAALVLASLLQPSLRPDTIEGAIVYVPRATHPLWPSTARPDLSWRSLALFVALFLPCFNLATVVRSRRVLRTLLWAVIINTVVLAIFGSLQKLMHARGLFFGAVSSPNERFFASFIYQNHWGAFAVLSIALALGLLFEGRRDPRYRNFAQSPAFLALIGTLFIGASIPLSASRSCTLLSVILLGAAIVHAFRRLSHHRVSPGIRAGLVLATLVAAVGVFQLATPIMQGRLNDTRAQWAQMRQSGSMGTRVQLYRDTWSMAKDRLVYGWGLGSYPVIFSRYNRQVSIDRLPVYYEDAHSDWLQSIAETGMAGTLCRALLLVLPLWSIRRARASSAALLYPLGGCAVILLYAGVEFPFGNPAVTLLFWLCWFSAIRLVQLEARERAT